MILVLFVLVVLFGAFLGFCLLVALVLNQAREYRRRQ